jgi:hypothetical protein
MKRYRAWFACKEAGELIVKTYTPEEAIIAIKAFDLAMVWIDTNPQAMSWVWDVEEIYEYSNGETEWFAWVDEDGRSAFDIISEEKGLDYVFLEREN